jgi:hypothetical protein
MYTNDENGSRVSEVMSTDELKEETPIREIRKSTIGGEERGTGCRIEGKGEIIFGVLASDIACDNHKCPLKECVGDSVDKIHAIQDHLRQSKYRCSGHWGYRELGTSQKV